MIREDVNRVVLRNVVSTSIKNKSVDRHIVLRCVNKTTL